MNDQLTLADFTHLYPDMTSVVMKVGTPRSWRHEISRMRLEVVPDAPNRSSGLSCQPRHFLVFAAVGLARAGIMEGLGIPVGWARMAEAMKGDLYPQINFEAIGQRSIIVDSGRAWCEVDVHEVAAKEWVQLRQTVMVDREAPLKVG